MEKIEDFLRVSEFPNGSGDGSGDGSGYGNEIGGGYDNFDEYEVTGYECDNFCGFDGSGDGSGYGYLNGSGHGSGYGSGYGSIDGSGDGSGCYPLHGSGDGSGYGKLCEYGDDIKEINHQKIYKIDDLETIIDSVHGNYAKGRILDNDLTTTECFIAKCGNYFAHGETLKQAFSDVIEKYNENKPIEERIKEFNEKFPKNDIPYLGSELFSWHHILTGSCLFGRQQFCKEHELDVNKKYTIIQFIELTENAFGGNIIKMLKESRKL